jgi:ankyrin repeat protein
MTAKSALPVYEAIRGGNLADLVSAISRGEAVDALDRDGRTPLFEAARQGNVPATELLLKSGAAVNVQDNRGMTPLHFAAENFRIAVAELLVANGANVNCQDIFGKSPLHTAVLFSRGRGEMINLLLAEGADRHLQTKTGVTPEGLAISNGKYDVGQFFIK